MHHQRCHYGGATLDTADVITVRSFAELRGSHAPIGSERGDNQRTLASFFVSARDVRPCEDTESRGALSAGLRGRKGRVFIHVCFDYFGIGDLEFEVREQDVQERLYFYH